MAEQKVMAELGQFLARLRSLDPPPAWCVPDKSDEVRASEVIVLQAADQARVEQYLRHLADNGSGILAQVELIIQSLAEQLHAAQQELQKDKGKDRVLENALFALMQYLISNRGKS